MNLEFTLFQEIVVVLFWVLVGGFCAYTARLRGRDPLSWFFIGLIFGFFGLIALLVMPLVKKEVPVEPPKKVEFPDPFKDKLWYYFDADRKQVGPIRFEELVAAWDNCTIHSESFVWCEGFENWIKIQDQKELYTFLTAE